MIKSVSNDIPDRRTIYSMIGSFWPNSKEPIGVIVAVKEGILTVVSIENIVNNGLSFNKMIIRYVEHLTDTEYGAKEILLPVGQKSHTNLINQMYLNRENL